MPLNKNKCKQSYFYKGIFPLLLSSQFKNLSKLQKQSYLIWWLIEHLEWLFTIERENAPCATAQYTTAFIPRLCVLQCFCLIVKWGQARLSRPLCVCVYMFHFMQKHLTRKYNLHRVMSSCHLYLHLVAIFVTSLWLIATTLFALQTSDFTDTWIYVSNIFQWDIISLWPYTLLARVVIWFWIPATPLTFQSSDFT